MRNTPGVFVAVSLALAGSAVAQTTAENPPAAQPIPTSITAPAAPSSWSHWGTDVSLMFDGYVDGNFNRPSSGYNALRNFDVRADTAHLNMAMITIDHSPGPVGFHLDVGYGQMFDLVHSTDRAPGELQYFKQAYISLKPKSWHGVEVDAGEFVTAAGAEVIEANQNWNYSRSLLFAWAIPYYHFGVRTSFPVGPHFTGGVQLVNGWNNIKDNNSGKTVGFNGAYAWKTVTWSSAYYGGPEKDHTNQGWRQLYDTTVLFTPSKRASYYLNFDYGRDKDIGPTAQQWTGVAVAGRWAIGPKYAIASRAEWYDDMDGFTTGKAQSIKEFTLTGEYQVSRWLLSRIEFRDDWSNRAFCQREKGVSRNQPTVLLAMIAYFGPKK